MRSSPREVTSSFFRFTSQKLSMRNLTISDRTGQEFHVERADAYELASALEEIAEGIRSSYKD